MRQDPRIQCRCVGVLVGLAEVREGKNGIGLCVESCWLEQDDAMNARKTRVMWKIKHLNRWTRVSPEFHRLVSTFVICVVLNHANAKRGRDGYGYGMVCIQFGRLWRASVCGRESAEQRRLRLKKAIN